MRQVAQGKGTWRSCDCRKHVVQNGPAHRCHGTGRWRTKFQRSHQQTDWNEADSRDEKISRCSGQRAAQCGRNLGRRPPRFLS